MFVGWMRKKSQKTQYAAKSERSERPSLIDCSKALTYRPEEWHAILYRYAMDERVLAPQMDQTINALLPEWISGWGGPLVGIAINVTRHNVSSPTDSVEYIRAVFRNWHQRGVCSWTNGRRDGWLGFFEAVLP